MKVMNNRKKSLIRIVLATFSLTLAAIGVLLCPCASQGQEEPNRQLVQTGAANATNAKRIALVIGNGSYTNAPPLKNPPNDARDMAATLRLLGFTVASAIDADRLCTKSLCSVSHQAHGGFAAFFAVSLRLTANVVFFEATPQYLAIDFPESTPRHSLVGLTPCGKPEAYRKESGRAATAFSSNCLSTTFCATPCGSTHHEEIDS